MKNPDEIMAEYLLKGGKMLAKSCSRCGSPLFEYKGETLCVVCRERGDEAETGTQAEPPEQAGVTEPGAVVEKEGADRIAGALAATIIALCARAREEDRPEDCLMLMECIRNGIEAYTKL